MPQASVDGSPGAAMPQAGMDSPPGAVAPVGPNSRVGRLWSGWGPVPCGFLWLVHPHAPTAPVMLVGETSSGSWECLLHLLRLLCVGLGWPSLHGVHCQGVPVLLLGRRVLLSPCGHPEPPHRPPEVAASCTSPAEPGGDPTSSAEAPLPPCHLGVHRPRAGRDRVCGDSGSWARLAQQVGVVLAPPGEDSKS